MNRFWGDESWREAAYCTTGNLFGYEEKTTNEEMARIDIPESHPAPHGMSAYEGGFIYCDSSTGWIGTIETEV